VHSLLFHSGEHLPPRAATRWFAEAKRQNVSVGPAELHMIGHELHALYLRQLVFGDIDVIGGCVVRDRLIARFLNLF
jgi:hypothetical protein